MGVGVFVDLLSLRRSEIMIAPKPETSLCCVTVWDLDLGEDLRNIFGDS
jgi:hypothetical protein